MDAEELRLTVQVEIIVRCVRGDVVGRHQSQVKLEASVLLVYDVKYLLQTQPVFSCTGTSRGDTQISDQNFQDDDPTNHKTSVVISSGYKIA